MEIKYPRPVQDLLDFFKGHELDAFLVGGAVRDFLLTGKLGKDLDFEVHGGLSHFIPTVKAFVKQKTKSKLQLLPFQVCRISIDDLILELAPARREEYISGRFDHKNFDHHYIPYYRFTESFKRRDLTINAIGYGHRLGEWIDPFNGMSDLKHNILHPCSADFVWDPVRYLRAIRFSLATKMDFSPELKKLLPQMNLSKLSEHHFLTELFKSNDHPQFFQLCRQWNASLPEEWQNLGQVIGKSKIKIFQDTDHLIYEYFQRRGQLEDMAWPFLHKKKWAINFFLILQKVSYAQWKKLLQLDYHQFKNHSQTSHYLFLFQSFKRYRPCYLFLTPDHKMLLEDFTLRLQAASVNRDQIHYKERSLNQLYFSGKHSF